MTDEDRVVCPRDLRELEWERLPLCDIEGAGFRDGEGNLLGEEKLRVMPREQRLQVLRSGVYKQCPSASCRMLLPHDYAENQRIVLGVLGVPAASKSTYLGALVKLLVDRGLADLGVRVDPLVVADHRRFADQFIRPAFTDRRALEVTTAGKVRGPYCYRLHNLRTGALANLVLLDSSGEDLTSDRGKFNAAYVAEADGLIFLLDPTQMPLVARSIDCVAPDPEPQQLLVKGLLEPLRGLDARRRDGTDLLSAPAAVAIAKSDLLGVDGLYSGAEGFLAEDGTSDKVDLDQVERENLAVISFLYENDEAVIAEDVMHNFFDFSFHFVSATNTGTEVRDGRKTYVEQPEPKRVLQPLVVILRRLGFLSPNQTRGTSRW
jgi:hypothetical protein